MPALPAVGVPLSKPEAASKVTPAGRVSLPLSLRAGTGTPVAVTGKRPAVLPNFGGSLPNDVFTDVLRLPTIWVPHSYPGCSQHAPDEHILLSVTEEALGIMAGLFWDLGEMKRPT